MSIDTKTTGIPAQILAEMQAAATLAASGIRDPEAARKAREETDRIREEVFRKHGVLDIGVPVIRDIRDNEVSR